MLLRHILPLALGVSGACAQPPDDDASERKLSRFVTLSSQAALVEFVAREHPAKGYEHLAITGTIDDLAPLSRLHVPILDLTIGPTSRLASTHGIEALEVRGSLTVADNAALAALWGPRLTLDGFGEPACVTLARSPLTEVHLASLPTAPDCLAIRDAATARALCVLDVGDACPTLREDLCSDGGPVLVSGCAR